MTGKIKLVCFARILNLCGEKKPFVIPQKMQKEGKVRFLKYHDKAVKSVSFNPKERYIFCSCASDGKVGCLRLRLSAAN